MISKMCSRCGKKIPTAYSCSCTKRLKNKANNHRKYNNDVKKFYSTKEWTDARERCIAKCYGIDLYSFFLLNRIEYGEVVHHIVPIVDDYCKRISDDNLIYLTERNHKLIHSLYENSYYETVELLQSLLKRGYGKMFDVSFTHLMGGTLHTKL